MRDEHALCQKKAREELFIMPQIDTKKNRKPQNELLLPLK